MTKKYRMGPAAFYFDGAFVDVLTRGVEAVVTPQLKNIQFDQDPDYDDVLTGLSVEVRIAMAVSSETEMDMLLPYINKIVGAGKVLYDGVTDVGRSMREQGKELELIPLDLDDGDSSNTFYMPKATCISPFRLVYKYDDEQIVEAVFKGYSQDSITKRKFQIGDRDANPDTQAPTVESTTPTAGQTSVSKATGLKIDFVMSEDILPSTVNKGNTIMIKTTDQSVVGDYKVEYLSASKTIRLTTTKALTGTTEYAVFLGSGIKDLNNNALTTYALKFTTGS